MKKILILLLLLTGCSVRKPSPENIELARCICKKFGYELLSVESNWTLKELTYECKNSGSVGGYHINVDTYFEGCTK